ncbi:uncharacterized protein LOC124274277 [Haliotis rubra]|uniref:uncharacterized protein LOC124274277 n=1 Tax=Haliotis rubra TaxID=36100 RepID=UPI001EE5E0B5|nr:uncharacterized protein LOC124274277 [Haliotis rubra]
MSQNQNPGSSKTTKRRHVESLSSDEEVSPDVAKSWPKFIVLSSADGNPLKINPFAVTKGIQSVCGEVKNVNRLHSGSLLVECARKQQSVNLLGLQEFVNTKVVVSVHKSLNSCRGIVRDRAKCLSDMSEDEISASLTNQGVTSVKRFTRKQDNTIINTNTYLFTFALSTLPKSIKAGYFNIGVDVYIPSPLRCFNCQKFGHGARTCNHVSICVRCSGAHESAECTNEIKCANCDGQHLASSKSCPSFEHQSKILKLKYTNNISFAEAQKLVPITTRPTVASYSAAVSSSCPVKVSQQSVSCQTEISWVTDTQVIFDQSVSSETVHKTSSASKTEEQSEALTVPTSDQENGTIHLSKNQRKQLKKKGKTLKHLEVPSSLDAHVTVHNPFEPLHMDVTPSLPIHESGHSIHSRPPVEPP